jgi:hypothetical protein
MGVNRIVLRDASLALLPAPAGYALALDDDLPGGMAAATGERFDLAFKAPYGYHQFIALLGKLIGPGLRFSSGVTLDIEQLVQAPDHANVSGVHGTVSRIPGQPLAQPEEGAQQHGASSAQPGDGAWAEVSRVHENLISNGDVVSRENGVSVAFLACRFNLAYS